jgi:hypothetical protein
MTSSTTKVRPMHLFPCVHACRLRERGLDAQLHGSPPSAGVAGEEGEQAGSDGADDEDDNAGFAPPEEAIEVAAGEEGDEADDDDDPFGHKKRKKKKKESESQMAVGGWVGPREAEEKGAWGAPGCACPNISALCVRVCLYASDVLDP